MFERDLVDVLEDSTRSEWFERGRRFAQENQTPPAGTISDWYTKVAETMREINDTEEEPPHA